MVNYLSLIILENIDYLATHFDRKEWHYQTEIRNLYISSNDKEEKRIFNRLHYKARLSYPPSACYHSQTRMVSEL